MSAGPYNEAQQDLPASPAKAGLLSRGGYTTPNWISLPFSVAWRVTWLAFYVDNGCHMRHHIDQFSLLGDNGKDILVGEGGFV